MGAAGMLAKWVGKTLGEKAFGIERKSVWFRYEGHNPFEPALKNVWTYEEKLADLAHETHKVDTDYLRELAKQAAQRHDFTALKTIYKYALEHDYGAQFIATLIKYGQDAKLYHHIGNPFALVDIIEKAVNALC